jgi:hypothetical protein
VAGGAAAPAVGVRRGVDPSACAAYERGEKRRGEDKRWKGRGRKKRKEKKRRKEKRREKRREEKRRRREEERREEEKKRREKREENRRQEKRRERRERGSGTDIVLSCTPAPLFLFIHLARLANFSSFFQDKAQTTINEATGEREENTQKAQKQTNRD